MLWFRISQTDSDMEMKPEKEKKRESSCSIWGRTRVRNHFHSSRSNVWAFGNFPFQARRFDCRFCYCEMPLIDQCVHIGYLFMCAHDISASHFINTIITTTIHSSIDLYRTCRLYISFSHLFGSVCSSFRLYLHPPNETEVELRYKQTTSCI